MAHKHTSAVIISFITLIFIGCNDNNAVKQESNITKIKISAKDSFPTALGCEEATEMSGASHNKCYLLANGTIAEVVEWNKKYSNIIEKPFAQIDMWSQNKVKILNGQSKGKTLYVAHEYIEIVE